MAGVRRNTPRKKRKLTAPLDGKEKSGRPPANTPATAGKQDKPTPASATTTKSKPKKKKRRKGRRYGTGPRNLHNQSHENQLVETQSDKPLVMEELDPVTEAVEATSDGFTGAHGSMLHGWAWYESMGSPKYILSPMVGQSELAFRMLTRRHGVQAACTPMFISRQFVIDGEYRSRVWSTCTEDRPLVVQFCGRDADTLLQAARLVEKQCDAIDINLGCPQSVAKRGGYGAFMMEDWQLLHEIVSTLTASLSVPVTCKIRRFKDYDQTLAYAQVLQQAGCSLLTVHPRQREEKEEMQADWTVVARLKHDLHIPVVANGDMWHWEDVQLCLQQTEVDGCMSAQGLLHNPALFEPLANRDNKAIPSDDCLVAHSHVLAPSQYRRKRRQVGPTMNPTMCFSFNKQTSSSSSTSSSPSASSAASSSISNSAFFSTAVDVHRQFKLAREYVECCRRWPVCHPSVARRHIFFMLFDCFQANTDYYDRLHAAEALDEYSGIIEGLLDRAERGKRHGDTPERALSRTRRRDGTLAPPPWPIGGGGFNTGNQPSASKHKKAGRTSKKKTKTKKKTSRKQKSGGPSDKATLKRPGSKKKKQKKPALQWF